ncbi:MAG: transglutaminase protein [Frankiales bacterium]|nr:transglutaminase protein [Frankiales bacterium]
MGWRLRVEHVTRFTYDRPAMASYNEARMTPLTTAGQMTLDARMTVTPAVSVYRYWDYWGAQVVAFDVHEPHDVLALTARSLVETVQIQAVSEPPRLTWAELLAASSEGQLAELTAATPRTTMTPELIAQVAADLRKDLPLQTAYAVAEWVRDRLTYMRGTTTVRSNAQQVWDAGSGVCQDLAHVAIALLRGLGIPCRYVSGYLHPRKDAAIGEVVRGESHAWIEWWAGEWFAFDPTNGTVPGERHIVVARGRDYGDVTPFKGVYRGGASSLEVLVDVTRLA